MSSAGRQLMVRGSRETSWIMGLKKDIECTSGLKRGYGSYKKFFSKC